MKYIVFFKSHKHTQTFGKKCTDFTDCGFSSFICSAQRPITFFGVTAVVMVLEEKTKRKPENKLSR